MTEQTSAGETGGREAMSDARLAEIRHLVYAIDLPGGAYPSLTRELLAEVQRLRANAEADWRGITTALDGWNEEAGNAWRAYAEQRQRAETAERELAGMRERIGDWEPGRWHQVRRPDGSLWMETSDREEAEAEARRQGWPLYRLWECRGSEWRESVGEGEAADGA